MKINEVQNGAELKDCIKLPLMFLEIAGLWSTRQKNYIFRISYNIYVILMIFLHCSSLFGQSMNAFFTQIAIENKMESIIIWITEIIALCKMQVFLFNKEKVQYLITAVQENFYKDKTNISAENRKIIQSTLKFTKKLNIFYAMLVNFGMLFYVDVAPFMIGNSVIEVNNGKNISLTSERTLPYNVWVPIDVETSKYYPVVYVFLVLIGHAVAFVFTSTQTMFFTLILFLKVQFEMLCNDLRSLSQNVTHKLQNNTGKEKLHMVSLLLYEIGCIWVSFLDSTYSGYMAIVWPIS